MAWCPRAVGIWNERGYTIDYIDTLRSTLNAYGFQSTAIVAHDAGWDIAGDILNNATLAASVDVIGVHVSGVPVLAVLSFCRPAVQVWPHALRLSVMRSTLVRHPAVPQRLPASRCGRARTCPRTTTCEALVRSVLCPTCRLLLQCHGAVLRVCGCASHRLLGAHPEPEFCQRQHDCACVCGFVLTGRVWRLR